MVKVWDNRIIEAEHDWWALQISDGAEFSAFSLMPFLHGGPRPTGIAA